MKIFFQITISVFLMAHAQAAPTLTDFWNGKAAWVKDSGKIGANFGFHFPSIISGNRELYAYYIHNYTAGDGKFKMAIGRARGADGIKWTDDGMVLDVSHALMTNGTPFLWDDRLASFPGAWKDGDTWYLVYEGAGENGVFPGDIGLATSKDGKNFVKHPNNPILRHNTNDWERTNIGTPSLYKENGVWYLFYHGYDGSVCQIGVASGMSLTNLIKSAANPILPVASRTNAWDSGTVGRRSAIKKEGAYYYFAFEGSTSQPFELAKWSSSLARSTNLTSNWIKFPGNQMIPQTASGFGYDGPELLRLSNDWFLYVRTPKGNETERFRLKANEVRPVAKKTRKGKPLYTYALAHDTNQASYDEAMAVASLQGIINRESDELYLLSRTNMRPQFWLDLLSKDRRWLEGRKQKPLTNLDELVKLAGKRLKGAIIWDPGVPASANVATTIAGVQDAIVLSPEFADRYLPKWRLKVLHDLRGKFTGAETGSKKNDAYRWAIREYLAQGKCSSHLLCLFEDSFSTRARGDIGYVLTRDWAVKNRSFVFDLSPWGDEKPGDDSDQRAGLDLETYNLILAETLRQTAGKQMTELTGFFAFTKYSDQPNHKSAHKEVPTEWETVWLISPFNCYQNTISSDCFNQSFHSQFPRQPLKQKSSAKPVSLENKNYICILMADYDSSTPLYDFLPNHWQNEDRGKTPLAWGVNPNQLENYPDLVDYFYGTATTNDTFTADASAAGYMNPNRIRQEYLPLFVRHNQQFFREADMTIAPMVLDRDQPSPEVKDAFQQFAPDGYATIVADVFGGRGTYPASQVWNGMPILELFNDTCNSKEPGQIADVIANVIASRGNKVPGFYFFRAVWVSPATITDAVARLHRQHLELNCEVLDPKTFFALFKKSQLPLKSNQTP